MRLDSEKNNVQLVVILLLSDYLPNQKEMTIHHIKLKDLNGQFIRQLKAQSQDLEQKVTIWLPKKVSGIKEEEAWEIIGMLDWKKENSEAILAPAITHLSQLPEAKITAFEDWLSEKLYQLDGQKYAENTGDNAFRGNGNPFSVDSFLYARCMVVASGQKVYGPILENPAGMLKNQTFEPLLNLASRAYKRKTGKEWEHLPALYLRNLCQCQGLGRFGRD